MGKTHRISDRRILIFTRYPVPGKTKTRLIPKLGPVGAARLHRRLAEKIFSTAKSYAAGEKAEVIGCFDGADEKQIRRWLHWEIPLWSQEAGDLGRRMLLAFARAFHEGPGPVVLVGSDIFQFEERYFDGAFDALRTHDLVLGPSTDGGYWLVGMNRLIDVFKGIDWGTRQAFRQTTELAERSGLRMHALGLLSDIDTPEDLDKLMPEQLPQKPYVSVVIPSLNEEKRIAAAITSALDPDAEILVVDGKSHDRTVEIAQSLGATVISRPPGRALQQNFGARHARGAVLLFLHADSRLPENYVLHVFDVLMNRETVLGAFGFETTIQNNSRMKLIETGVAIRSSVFGLPYGDQGLFMRRKDFLHAGGFPEVLIAEDLLLVERLSHKGKVAIAPALVVTSGRRWRLNGVFRTFLINQLVLGACLLGLSPDKLAPLYRTGRNPVNRKS
jgi:uncharacterized protein